MTSGSKQVLADFAQNGSEAAFRQLVERYTDLVYSTAFRMAEGDMALAQDVTQTVFLDLARMAGKLSGEVMLGGWLHRHTCFVCSTALRAERRRRKRERQAAEMNTPLQSPTGLDQIGPILDQAINQLSEADRKAILFRFFEQANFRTVGEALGVNEYAARMRVSRALEKLHWILRKRGFAGSSAVLGALLTGGAVMSAPSWLAATVSSAALTNFCCGNSSATLMKVILMTKLKTTLVGALLVAGVAASVVIHRQAKARIEAQRATLEQRSGQLAQLSAENGRLSNLLANANADKPRDDISELLRLRGEVGVLIQQLTESKAEQKKNAPNVQLNPNATSDPQEEEKRVLTAKMNFTKQSMLALINYAAQNQGRFPTNFPTAEPGLADEAHQRNLAMDQFEIVYQGSLNDLTNPGSTIIMREKDPQQTPRGTWQRVYGFADGSSQARESTDGNFQSWEQQHIVMSSPTVQPGQ